MARPDDREREERTAADITLTAAGITLLGVIVSVGATVGFGVGGPWWVKVLAGLVTSVVLAFLASWSTSTGRGVVARLANWLIGGGR